MIILVRLDGPAIGGGREEEQETEAKGITTSVLKFDDTLHLFTSEHGWCLLQWCPRIANPGDPPTIT